MQKIGLTVTVILIFLTVILIIIPASQADHHLQNLPEVYAEAIGSANLRSGPSTDYQIVGEITSGTAYRVLKQHSQVPWLLLEVPELPTQAGWVYKDLVQVTRGDLNSVPFENRFEELTINHNTAPTMAATPAEGEIIIQAPAITITPTAAEMITGTAAGTPVPAGTVIARFNGRSNVRYGPGTEYPIVATYDRGTALTVLARHSTFPWYKVEVDAAAGAGWVFGDIVDIEGDINQLPVESALQIIYPTPTPTPITVVGNNVPWDNFGVESQRLVIELGNRIHNYLVPLEIAPYTDKEASVFVMDLQTRESFTLNGNVAYSGTSMNKIPVLVTYFRYMNAPLQSADASTIANTMICSQNTATNQLLTDIGQGDILLGGQRVSDLMLELSLGNTFVLSPYDVGLPDPTRVPAIPIQTTADQIRNQPDELNQLTVEDLGWLLGSMYQCAVNGTGPLIDTFPDDITQLECRKMLRVMSANHIGRLIEASVDENSLVAHKHGWVANTHGDAGIVLGPEGDFVFVMVYHEHTDWLSYDWSFPVIEQVARMTWNYFNPDFPKQSTTPDIVPETCEFDDSVLLDLLSPDLAMPGAEFIAPEQFQPPTPIATAMPSATATLTNTPVPPEENGLIGTPESSN